MPEPRRPAPTDRTNVVTPARPADPIGPASLPFRYPGSKATMMARVLPFLPEHDHCVVVFGGSGAELLRKPPSRAETYNDLSQDVVAFFRVLRDPAALADLLWQIKYTPLSRQEYEACVTLLQGGSGSAVDRAYALAVVGNQGRAGRAASVAAPTDWGYRVKPARRDRWPVLPDILERVAARFEEVQIENRDFEDVLRLYDRPATLFLIDPPYPFRVRASAARLYPHEMTDQDHERLLAAVRRLRGYAVLWGYDNAVYAERLGGWARLEFETRCYLAAGDHKPARKEVAWLNFDPSLEPRAFPNP